MMKEEYGGYLIVVVLVLAMTTMALTLYGPWDDRSGSGLIAVTGSLVPQKYNSTNDSLVFQVILESDIEDNPIIPNTTNESKMWVEIRDNGNKNRNVNWTYIDSNNDSYFSTGDNLILYNASQHLNKGNIIILKTDVIDTNFSASGKIEKPKT